MGLLISVDILHMFHHLLRVLVLGTYPSTRILEVKFLSSHCACCRETEIVSCWEELAESDAIIDVP